MPNKPIVRGFSTSSFPGDCPAPRQLKRQSSSKKRRQSEFTPVSPSVFDGALAAASSAVSSVTSNILPKRSLSAHLTERSHLIDEIDGNINTKTSKTSGETSPRLSPSLTCQDQGNPGVKFTVGGGASSSSSYLGQLGDRSPKNDVW